MLDCDRFPSLPWCGTCIHGRSFQCGGISSRASAPASDVKSSLLPVKIPPMIALVLLKGCVFGLSFTLDLLSAPATRSDNVIARGEGGNCVREIEAFGARLG